MRVSSIVTAGLMAAMGAALVPGLPMQVSGQTTTPATAPMGNQFEQTVRSYEEADRKSFPPAGAILLVGDSQFYRWKTVNEDLAGYTVINRGIDSFQASDLNYFFDRLVTPYKPRMVVVHVGGNDVHTGKTAMQVVADYQTFVGKVRKILPAAGAGMPRQRARRAYEVSIRWRDGKLVAQVRGIAG